MLKYTISSLIFSASISSALAYQNEPDGFRGYKWGESFGIHQNDLNLIEQNDDQKFYLRKDEPMNLGPAVLEKIVYVFYKEKFQGVFLEFSEGSSNQNSAIMTFKERFGQGSKPNEFIDEYEWLGGITFIDLKCNMFSNKCLGVLVSRAMQKEQENDKQNKAKKAGKDF